MSDQNNTLTMAVTTAVIGIALSLLGLGVYLALEVYGIVKDILYVPEKVALIDMILKHEEIQKAVTAMQQAELPDIDYGVLVKIFITIVILYFLLKVLGSMIVAIFSGVASVLHVLPESVFKSSDEPSETVRKS